MATAYDTIQVSIRSNDGEFPVITVLCEMDWCVRRVKQEIQTKHPKHFPLEVQVIYYEGIRLKDEVVLSDIFKPSLFQDSPKPNYTLWLANVSENKVIQEFLSLPKSTLPPNEFNSHPYYSALQYYNYIHGKSSENTNKLTEQNQTDPHTPNGPGDAAVNPERPDNQEGEDFNFLGGRLQGVGLEEAQEQNAIGNAINLIVRLTLLLYITYQFAPQYKFYLVIAFSGIMFLYQLGIFRVNRVNIPRFREVENQIRERENNPQNQQENNREETTNENGSNKSDKSDKEEKPTKEATDDINIPTDQNGIQGETEVLPPNELPSPGVLSSVSTLLYNLCLSFHPEYNVQV